MSQQEIYLNVNSPPVTWKALPRYKLENIKRDFKVADFERNISFTHVDNIVKAILNNEFFDNVIRVIKEKNEFALIDAQHRIQALWICYQRHGLKEYDLMLAIYPKEFARLIYTRLNMGKKLLMSDHSRALDDKKKPFFNDLRQFLYHYRTNEKASYTDLLNAYNYAKGSKNTIQIQKLPTLIEEITEGELKIMIEFCKSCKRFSPMVFGSAIYKTVIYRNVFKIGFKNKWKENQFNEMFEIASSNKELLSLITGKWRKYKDVEDGYKIILTQCLPKMEQNKK